jgi:hypothetical protein
MKVTVDNFEKKRGIISMCGSVAAPDGIRTPYSA